MKNALLIGSNGTIGHEIGEQLKDQYDLRTLSQNDTDYSEASLEAIAAKLQEHAAFSLIVCCIGTLHNEIVSPEKRLNHLTESKLAEYFRINTILPALCMRYFSPMLDQQSPSRMVFLSAMVGSIGDNKLGGWYGYRSSKAALNMMVKTASVEIARGNKAASIVAVHPGTTQGPLSKPFSSGVAKDKYYTPQQSAERIIALAESLTAEQTGQFFNWDGSNLPW